MQLVNLIVVNCELTPSKLLPENVSSIVKDDSEIKRLISHLKSPFDTSDVGFTYYYSKLEKKLKDKRLNIDNTDVPLVSFEFNNFMVRVMELSKDTILNDKTDRRIIHKFYKTLVDIHDNKINDVAVYKYIDDTLSKYNIEDAFNCYMNVSEDLDDWCETFSLSIIDDLNTMLIYELLREAVYREEKTCKALIQNLKSNKIEEIISLYKNYYVRLKKVVYSTNRYNTVYKNFKNSILTNNESFKLFGQVSDRAYANRVNIDKSFEKNSIIIAEKIDETNFDCVLKNLVDFGELKGIHLLMTQNLEIYNEFPRYNDDIYLINIIKSKHFNFFSSNTDFLKDIINYDNEKILPIITEQVKIHFTTNFGSYILDRLEVGPLKDNLMHIIRQLKCQSRLYLLIKDTSAIEFKRPDAIYDLKNEDITLFFIETILDSEDSILVDKIVKDIKDNIKDDPFYKFFDNFSESTTNSLFIHHFLEMIIKLDIKTISDDNIHQINANPSIQVEELRNNEKNNTSVVKTPASSISVNCPTKNKSREPEDIIKLVSKPLLQNVPSTKHKNDHISQQKNDHIPQQKNVTQDNLIPDEKNIKIAEKDPKANILLNKCENPKLNFNNFKNICSETTKLDNTNENNAKSSIDEKKERCKNDEEGCSSSSTVDKDTDTQLTESVDKDYKNSKDAEENENKKESTQNKSNSDPKDITSHSADGNGPITKNNNSKTNSSDPSNNTSESSNKKRIFAFFVIFSFIAVVLVYVCFFTDIFKKKPSPEIIVTRDL